MQNGGIIITSDFLRWIMLLPMQKQKLKQKQNKLKNRSYESRFKPALFFISGKSGKFAA